MIFIRSNLFTYHRLWKVKPYVIQSSVFLKFQPGLSDMENGYWNKNNSVSQNKNYQERIKYLIDKYVFKYIVDFYWMVF